MTSIMTCRKLVSYVTFLDFLLSHNSCNDLFKD